MKTLTTLALIMFTVSCGQLEEQASDATAKKDDEKSALQQINYSRAVYSKGDLPYCDDDNLNLLVYVRLSKEFYTCSMGVWEPVTLSGSTIVREDFEKLKGAEGSKGEKGPKGDKGDTVTTNHWYDPITGHLWLIGATANWNFATCGGEYSLPTRQEALDAVQHGMLIAANTIGGPQSYWTATEDASDSGRAYGSKLTSGVQVEGSYVKSTVMGVYCVNRADQ